MPGNTDPVTTGELVRRFDRMESNVITRLNQLDSEFVSHRVYAERMARYEQRMSELEKDVEQQNITRRQIFIGGALIVLGEIAALTIALSNLSARALGLTP